MNDLNLGYGAQETPEPLDAPILSVQGVRKEYVSKATSVLALADVSFDVRRGEFVSVVGPSGCGKTTLLKIMAGLISPTGGRVMVDGQPVVRPPRQLGLVFQDYSRSLFPRMTVEQNIRFPLKGAKRLPRAQQDQLVVERANAVGLGDFLRHYPWQLSGGMQQRVAIARALAYQPDILLMDEPFASVDAQTRAELEDLMLAIRAEFGMTVVFVTHDIDESVYLGDRVVVLSTRPTVVRNDLVVELPAPRDQITTKALPEYAELRSEVYREIREADGRKVA